MLAALQDGVESSRRAGRALWDIGRRPMVYDRFDTTEELVDHVSHQALPGNVHVHPGTADDDAPAVTRGDDGLHITLPETGTGDVADEVESHVRNYLVDELAERKHRIEEAPDDGWELFKYTADIMRDDIAYVAGRARWFASAATAGVGTAAVTWFGAYELSKRGASPSTVAGMAAAGTYAAVNAMYGLVYSYRGMRPSIDNVLDTVGQLEDQPDLYDQAIHELEAAAAVDRELAELDDPSPDDALAIAAEHDIPVEMEAVPAEDGSAAADYRPKDPLPREINERFFHPFGAYHWRMAYDEDEGVTVDAYDRSWTDLLRDAVGLYRDGELPDDRGADRDGLGGRVAGFLPDRVTDFVGGYRSGR